jgi:hypothetical protein
VILRLKQAGVLAAFAALAWAFAQAGSGKLEMRSQLLRNGAIAYKGDKPGQIDQPLALRVAPDGSAWVLSLDGGRKRLQRFNNAMEPIDEAPARVLQGLDNGLVGMAMGPDGTALVLDAQGRLRGIGPGYKARKDLQGLPKNARDIDGDGQGGCWVLGADGLELSHWSADGKALDQLSLSAGKEGLVARGIAVGDDGVPVALLTSPKGVYLRRADGRNADYRVAYVQPAVWIRPAALPQGRILINVAEGMGVLIVDLPGRRTWRRAFDSDRGDIFRSVGFIAADRKAGTVFVAYAGGLVAGMIP